MRGIRKLWDRWLHPKTLVGICVSRLFLYVAYVLIAYQVFISFSEEIWKQTFPEIDDYISYSSLLARDEFTRIPANQFKNCGILIYGEQGRIIYASDQDMHVLISEEEFRYIPDTSDNFTYRVMEGEDKDTWIFKVEEDTEVGEPNIDDFCHIGPDYQVIEGNLFQNTDKVSKRIVNFLKDVYGKNRSILKYSYTNQNDRERTLVFLTPAMTSDLMNEYFRKEYFLWIVSLICDIGGAVIISMAIARRIRLSILPLNTLFEDYSNEKGINRDVVIPEELASVEQGFVKLTEKLEASNQHRIEMEQEKNRMIADLSHDLKSPLTIISGYAQALTSGKIDAAEEKKYLELIHKKSNSSVEMINNLMQYATMEHPDYRMNRERIDLCEFLRVCLIGRYDEMEEREMELELEIPEEEVWYDIDRRIMGSVMENLINNTFRYNDAGTMIFVSLETSEEGLCITFADTGVGIPPEIRKDLFKPFVIGNQARTSTKGTGIGMSIIRRGVEMHGGTVTLADPEGTAFSTIFEMRFPKI